MTDISVEEIKGCSFVNLSGRIDASNSHDFQTLLTKTIENSSKQIVINCENLKYISSSGLRTFLSLQKEINNLNKQLKFCCLSESISELFDIAGFSSVFDIYKSKQDILSIL